MKLIVGLGNPGKEYEYTRHNVGFWFLDFYVQNKGIIDNWKSKFDALYLEYNLFGEKVIFVKPTTYMNLSGEAVKKFLDFYKIDVSNLLVVSDDLDILIGNFKLKFNCSSGGHNGIKNIAQMIGTNEFKRLKIGISKDNNIDMKDYVLGKINDDDKKVYLDLFEELVPVIDDFFNLTFGDLMSKYNKKNR